MAHPHQEFLGLSPPGKTIRFLYIIPLQPAVGCKPSYKRHEMGCTAVCCFVPKKSSMKLHYFGHFYHLCARSLISPFSQDLITYKW